MFHSIQAIFLMFVSTQLFAQEYSKTCVGEGCDVLQRIRGVADGAYEIGKDNNNVSVAFVSAKTLKGLVTEALVSFVPYQKDSNEADALRFQVAKDCVFFEKGAYGSHLPRYTATNITEPFYPAQELDLHDLAASSFWRNLRRIENQLATAPTPSQLKYSWIREIPSDVAFPARYEMLAAPCALAISWTKPVAQGEVARHMILRGGVTD